MHKASRPHVDNILILEIPLGFLAKLGNFRQSWRNNIPQKSKYKIQKKQ
jgi:hypothetical protein